MVRQYPGARGTDKAKAFSEEGALRLKQEWIDRLVDDGIEDPEELVYIEER